MFQTKARAWVWKATDVIDEDSVVSGLKAFINDNYTECYSIHCEKATAYDAYATLTDSINRSQGVYDQSHDIDSVANQTKRMTRAINAFMIANTQADEAYLLLEWAKENPQFIVTLSDEPSENAPALYPLTSTYAGHDLQGRFAFLPDALVLEANADYGLTVNLPGKNQNVMAIDNLGPTATIRTASTATSAPRSP